MSLLKWLVAHLQLALPCEASSLC